MINCMFYIICVFVVSRQSLAQNIDGALLGDSLGKIVSDKLGVSAMAANLANTALFGFSAASVPGDRAQIVNKLATDLNTKLTLLNTLVSGNRDFIVNNYASLPTSAPYKDCCSIKDPLTYDARFQTTVNINSACYRGDTTAQQSYKFASQAIVELFRAGLNKNQNIKWQYYGTVDGLLFVYPGIPGANCSSYDPRQRSWFTQTVVTNPRDIIIVLDNSLDSGNFKLGSLTQLQAAQNASTQILLSLGPKDRVAIVAFNKQALLADCSGANLEFALPGIKQEFSNFIAGLVNQGEYSNYTSGMEAAMRLLMGNCSSLTCTPQSNVFDSSNRDKVIVFMSGRDPQDSTTSNLNTLISSFKPNVTKPIKVYSYGLGDGSALVAQFLQYITSVSSVTTGAYKLLNSEVLLDNEISKFYEFFKSSSLSSTPVVSFPFMDAFGLGMVVAVTAPLLVNNDLVGVVGVDVTLTDLLSGFLSLQAGERSYSFVVDPVNNNVMGHPLLPPLYEVRDVKYQPIVVSLYTVEKDSNLNAFVKNILTGAITQGSQGIFVSKYFAKGNSFREGVYTINQTVTYYYQQLASSKYIAIFVDFADAYQKISFVRNLTAGDQRFIYHYSDIDPGAAVYTKTKCKWFYYPTYTGTTVVKFAPRAFAKPEQYLYAAETTTTVNGYRQSVLGTNTASTFVDGVTTDVQVTSFLNELWTNENGGTSLKTVIEAVWRYIATERGVFRLHPPAKITAVFDPAGRPWYKRAEAFPSQIVVVPPYLDYFGAGYIVTIAKALIEPGGTNVYAVMGIDVKMTTLYNYVTSLYQSCTADGFDCFLMDSAAYVVMHSNWIYLTYKAEPTVENIHVTFWEPEIANHMFSQGYIPRGSCNSILSQTRQFHSQVALPQTTVDHLETADAWYKISQVPSTNLYLVLKKKAQKFSTTSQCTCRKAASRILTPVCTLSSASYCECPCYNEAVCTSNISHQWIPCPPVNVDPFAMDSNAPSASNVANLDFCYNPNCKQIKTERDCNNNAQCHWCMYTTDGNSITPYCGYWQDCFLGQVNSRSPYTGGYGFTYVAPITQAPAPKRFFSAAIIAIITVAIIVVLVTIVGVYIYYLKHKGEGDDFFTNPKNLAEVLLGLTKPGSAGSKGASITIGPGGVPYLVLEDVDEKVLTKQKGNLQVPRGSIVLPHGSLLDEEDELDDGTRKKKKKRTGSIMIPLAGVAPTNDNPPDDMPPEFDTGFGLQPPPQGGRRASAVDDFIVGGRRKSAFNAQKRGSVVQRGDDGNLGPAIRVQRGSIMQPNDGYGNMPAMQNYGPRGSIMMPMAAPMSMPMGGPMAGQGGPMPGQMAADPATRGSIMMAPQPGFGMPMMFLDPYTGMAMMPASYGNYYQQGPAPTADADAKKTEEAPKDKTISKDSDSKL